jgi:hypothetical protein
MNHLGSNSRREMTYFDVHRPFVELLCTSRPTQQEALLNSASAEQIRCLCHCIENSTYSKETKDKRRPFKQDLADLAERSRSFRTRKEILVQRGSGPLLEGLAGISTK